MHTRSTLSADLLALGLAAGDIVMAHASVRAIGENRRRARRDPSRRSHGALAEFFRTYPGTRVNHHVARFAAWGRHAEHLLSPQPWDFAYGRGSIFERFVELDGKILLLGSDHDNVTFLHHAEHIVGLPDKRVARFKVPVMENGVRVWRDMKEFDTSQGAHDSWPTNIFSQIVDEHLAATRNHGGKVGDASSYLIGARDLLQSALSAMQLFAAN